MFFTRVLGSIKIFLKNPVYFLKWWFFYLIEYVFITMKTPESKQRRKELIKNRFNFYGLKFFFLIFNTYIFFSLLDFFLSKHVFYEPYWINAANHMFNMSLYTMITLYIYYFISFYFIDLERYTTKYWLIGMCVLYGIFLFEEQFFMDRVFKLACRWSPLALAIILIITFSIMPWVEWSPSIMDHPLWWHKTTWTEDPTSYFYFMNILQTTPEYVSWILEQYEKEFGTKYDGLPYRYSKKVVRPKYWAYTPWTRDDLPKWLLAWLKRSESWS